MLNGKIACLCVYNLVPNPEHGDGFILLALQSIPPAAFHDEVESWMWFFFFHLYIMLKHKVNSMEMIFFLKANF